MSDEFNTRGQALSTSAVKIGGEGVGAYKAARNFGIPLRAVLAAADYAPLATRLSLAGSVGAPAYYGTRAVVDHLPQPMQDKLTDTVGGTINQIGQSSGLWGVDDSAYLQQKAAQAAPAPQGIPRRAQAPIKPAAPVEPYKGTINQQFDQALGVHPRYVPSNPELQKLSSQYDQAMGYMDGIPRRKS